MHAVVRRSHNMRLKEIEEKRAAHERLKEDIVFTRKKSNFRSLRRAQNQREERENVLYTLFGRNQPLSGFCTAR